MRRAWQPTPVFPPGESHRQRSLAGTVHGVAKSRTWPSDLAHACTRARTHAPAGLSTTALAFPPQTSLSLFWINLSALLAPITTGCMAEWSFIFIFLKESYFFHLSFLLLHGLQVFLWAALYSNIILQTRNGNWKCLSKLRPLHAGQNQPTFLVLQWRHFHILSTLPSAISLAPLFTCCRFFQRALTHFNSFSSFQEIRE